MSTTQQQHNSKSSYQMKDQITSNQDKDDANKDFDNWNPMEEHFNSPLNTLAVDVTSDPYAALTGKSGGTKSSNKANSIIIGNIEICRRFLDYGSCSDGAYCSKQHVSPAAREQLYNLHLEVGTNAGRKVYTLLDFPPLHLDVSQDDLLLVQVTSVQLATNFYIVAPYETKNFANYSREDLGFYLNRVGQLSQTRHKVDTYHNELEIQLGNEYRLDNIKDTIYVGQVVACKMEEGRFNRALVISHTLDDAGFDLYQVRLLDVGLEIEVDRVSIFDITEAFMKDPPVAINCSLDLPKVSTALCKRFIEIIKKNDWFFARILHQSNTDDIVFCDLLTLDGKKSVTKLLLGKK